jgi:hypothetical protein
MKWIILIMVLAGCGKETPSEPWFSEPAKQSEYSCPAGQILGTFGWSDYACYAQDGSFVSFAEKN